MKAKVHIQWILSCPGGARNFFVWLFSCLSQAVLSIIRTNNLQNAGDLLPPRNSLCINKLRRSVTSQCRAAYETLFVSVCRLCCFYIPASRSPSFSKTTVLHSYRRDSQETFYRVGQTGELRAENKFKKQNA